MICPSIVVPLEQQAHPPFWPLLGQTQWWGNHEEGGRRSLYNFIFCLTSKDFSLSLIKGRLPSHPTFLVGVDGKAALSFELSCFRGAKRCASFSSRAFLCCCSLQGAHVMKGMSKHRIAFLSVHAARASQGFCSAPTLTVWPTRLIKRREAIEIFEIPWLKTITVFRKFSLFSFKGGEGGGISLRRVECALE